MKRYHEFKLGGDIVNDEVLLAMLENTGTAMFIINDKRKIIYANNQSMVNTEYSRDEIIGRDWQNFVHQDDKATLSSYYNARIKGQKAPYSYETRIITKSGKPLPVHCTVKFIKRAKICIASIIDISDRNQLLSDMNEESEFLRRLYSTASDGLITFDEQGRATNINAAMLKILSAKREKVLGKHYNMISTMFGLDLMEVSKSYDDFMENFEDVSKGEWKIINLKGEKHILEVSSSVLKRGKKIIGFTLCAHDITKRKQAENINKILYHISKASNETGDVKDLMRIIKNELEEIVDIRNFYIALYDQVRNLFYVPFLEDAKDDTEVFEPGKSLTAYVYRTGKTLHATIEKQKELLRKKEIEITGPQAQVWIGVPLKTENKVIGVLAILDYYDPQKYSEEDIKILEFVSGEIAKAIKRQQTKLQLERELKEKIVILGEIHHRVNNNLQIISSLLHLQANQIKTKEDALQGFKETQNRIMVMAKVYEALHDADYLSNINIENFIRSISYLLLMDYGKQCKILLKFSISKISLNMEILVPLGLILHELLSNAMKYAFENKTKGIIHITIRKTENEYLIIIEDNGKGLPEHINIHEPETFGLSLVKILKDQIDAHLEVKRKRGTKFVLSIPLPE